VVLITANKSAFEPEQMVVLFAVATAVAPNNGSSLYEVPVYALVRDAEFVAEIAQSMVAFTGVGTGMVPVQEVPDVFVMAIGACATPFTE
jgi:hypothetical protein